MDITTRLRLQSDVRVIPVADLTDEQRSRLSHHPDGFVVSRVVGRSTSKVVDRRGAELLARFRSPLTVAEAVIGLSHPDETRDRAPAVLDAAFPLIWSMIRAGFLVPEGVEQERLPSVAQRELPGYELVREVSRTDDTCVLLVRAPDGPFRMLKLARHEHPWAIRALRNERAILARVPVDVGPRLLDEGATASFEYFVTEWVFGRRPTSEARRLRTDPTGSREQVWELVDAMVAAYARLHESGVVHGDVHAGNALLDARGRVWLIDYALARHIDVQPSPGRGAVTACMDPQLADALLAGRPSPDASELGDQYALCALLYRVVCGVSYLDLQLEYDGVLRQIIEESPLPFRSRSGVDWPAAEEVIGRGLAKDPSDRFPSVAALSEAWRRARPPSAGPPSSVVVPSRSPDAVLSAFLRRCGRPGMWRSMEDVDVERDASVAHGRAGTSYALYRLACLSEDPRALALGDLCLAAVEDTRGAKSRAGRSSPFHGALGELAVRPLIGLAQGDSGAVRLALSAFVSAAREEGSERDVWKGRAGALLACALLYDRIRSLDAVDLTGLVDLAAAIDSDLEPRGPERAAETVGIAHGSAGVTYSRLLWSVASGARVPAACLASLDELRRHPTPRGRGVEWGEESPSRPSWVIGSWCNGAAGMVHLALLAHRVTGDDSWLQIAEQSGWTAVEGPSESPHLCCGLVGRAYAALALYRQSADEAWLRRARVLAYRAASGAVDFPGPWYSLYRGRLGLALLAADLARPTWSRTPFFDLESTNPMEEA